MRNYAMFDYDYLFGDHFAKVSNEARLLYIKLMFHATEGFVSNPLSTLDSLGYDRGVLNELISNGDILTLDGRCEVFITAYYVHNKNFNRSGWIKTPFSDYWRGKLWIKDNGVATLKQKTTPIYEPANSDKLQTEEKPQSSDNDSTYDWDVLLGMVDGGVKA